MHWTSSRDKLAGWARALREGDWQPRGRESAPAGTRARQAGDLPPALGERPPGACLVMGRGGLVTTQRSLRGLLAGRGLPDAEGRGQTRPASLGTVGSGQPRRVRSPERRAGRR